MLFSLPSPFVCGAIAKAVLYKAIAAEADRSRWSWSELAPRESGESYKNERTPPTTSRTKMNVSFVFSTLGWPCEEGKTRQH